MGDCVDCNTVDLWTIWYADGFVVSGLTDADWAALPDDGVVVVRLDYCSSDDERNGRIIQGSDFYFMAPGLDDWIYASTNESAEQILARYPQALIKRGQWVDDAAYARMTAEAL